MRERHQFTTTRWSVVLRARGDDPEQTRAALEQLCGEYWYPLYAYVRRSGKTPEDAADLTQSFFAKLLENDFLEGLTVEGGKFRSFLLRSLKWRKPSAPKRKRRKNCGSCWGRCADEDLIAMVY
jgi:DNA-directed RNA polymerase specialized sigma24 family protein